MGGGGSVLISLEHYTDEAANGGHIVRVQRGLNVLLLPILVLAFAPAARAQNLVSLTLNQTSVVGGSGATATVSLSGAAPAGGRSVSLASSDTLRATVPASITVAAGAQVATFTVTATPTTSTGLAAI